MKVKQLDLSLLKSPDACEKKEEVREQIDKIDKAILELFALRFEYVKSIVRFKNDRDEVIAQGRKDQVINDRSDWAEELGLDGQTFGDIYRLLIDSNIKKEMELLSKMKIVKELNHRNNIVWCIKKR